MKKIGLLLSSFSLFFLVACSTSSPSLISGPETETAYQQLLSQRQQEFTAYVAELGEITQTDTQVDVSFPAASALQGTASYTSSKYVDKADESDQISFDVNIQNFGKDTPLLTSGELETQYRDQTMYANIHHFNLFMGEGNAEVNFINLLIQQLSNKRIAIDSQDLGLAVVETPTISEFIAMIAYIYDNTNLTTELANDTYQVTDVNYHHLSLLEETLTLFGNFIDLPFSINTLSLDTTKENTITYTTTKDKLQSTRIMHYLVDTNEFSLATTLSDEQLTMEMTDFVVDGIENSTTRYVALTTQQPNQYIFQLKQTKEQKTEQDITLYFTIAQKDVECSVSFQGEATISALQLASGQEIILHFQGTKIFQNAERKIINMPEDAVSLSALLA